MGKKLDRFRNAEKKHIRLSKNHAQKRITYFDMMPWCCNLKCWRRFRIILEFKFSLQVKKPLQKIAKMWRSTASSSWLFPLSQKRRRKDSINLWNFISGCQNVRRALFGHLKVELLTEWAPTGIMTSLARLFNIINLIDRIKTEW